MLGVKKLYFQKQKKYNEKASPIYDSHSINSGAVIKIRINLPKKKVGQTRIKRLHSVNEHLHVVNVVLPRLNPTEK